MSKVEVDKEDESVVHGEEEERGDSSLGGDTKAERIT